MIINPDFKEFIQLLNAHEVKYLVVGGYAVSAHGYPRYTKDIDFWIWLESDNIEKLLAVLNDFGFRSLDLSVEDFSDSSNVVQLGHEPNRIDLSMQIDGVEFEKCYGDRVEVEIEGLSVNFIGIKDLIKAKKATGRYQDLADAENLEKIIEEQGKKND